MIESAPCPSFTASAAMERLNGAPSEMLARVDAATRRYAVASALYAKTPHAAQTLANAAQEFHEALADIVSWLKSHHGGRMG